MKQHLLTLLVVLIGTITCQINAQDTATKTSVKDTITISITNLAVQSNSFHVIEGDTISNGFFKWLATGNHLLDAVNIQVSSEKFKKDYPEIYTKIACDSSEVISITTERFNAFPPKLQTFILEHPLDYFVLPKK